MLNARRRPQSVACLEVAYVSVQDLKDFSEIAGSRKFRGSKRGHSLIELKQLSPYSSCEKTQDVGYCRRLRRVFTVREFSQSI